MCKLSGMFSSKAIKIMKQAVSLLQYRALFKRLNALYRIKRKGEEVFTVMQMKPWMVINGMDTNHDFLTG